MKMRSLLAALLLALSAALPSRASYSLSVSATNPPGPSTGNANSTYFGPNSFFGSINLASPGGIVGTGTPLHDGFGQPLLESGVFFGASGTGGTFNIGSAGDFQGTIANVDVGPGGGTFEVRGFLSDQAAAYFGVPRTQALGGFVSIGFSDPTIIPGRPGNGNVRGSLSLTLVPVSAAFSTPEPSSVLATGTGLIMAIGYGRRRRRLAA